VYSVYFDSVVRPLVRPSPLCSGCGRSLSFLGSSVGKLSLRFGDGAVVGGVAGTGWSEREGHKDGNGLVQVFDLVGLAAVLA